MLHTDIIMAPEVVQSSNVVIMNNVFECFLPLEQQAVIWRFLRQMLVPGTVLVTSPSLETTFLHLEVLLIDFFLSSAVSLFPFCFYLI